MGGLMPDNNIVNSGKKDNEGREVFQLFHTMPIKNRPVPGTKKVETAIENAEGSDEEDTATVSNDGLVRRRWRLLSAVKAYPQMSWFGPPQEIDYESVGDTVLPQIIPHISRTNPDLMLNHSDNVKDVVGWVESPQWEDSTDIPHGVNGNITVDPEFSGSQIAVGVKKGYIRSGSIGIHAHIVKSHPDMDTNEFMGVQGEVIDGVRVRWIPTEITSVDHMALLPHGLGADPHAGIRNSKTQNKQEKPKTEKPVSPVIIRGGGHNMAQDWKDSFCEVADLLNVDTRIEETPEGVQRFSQVVATKITLLQASHKSLIAIQEKIQRCEAYVLEADETGLKAEDILNRLPDALAYVAHGKAYLIHQKDAALKAFDAATVDPKADGMTENQKRIRARIAGSLDLGFIEEQYALFQEIVEKRYGPMKSADSEEIPKAAPVVVNDEEMAEINSFGGNK
jgi:hypothetical protein